jgi:hypothetical protein
MAYERSQTGVVGETGKVEEKDKTRGHADTLERRVGAPIA